MLSPGVYWQERDFSSYVPNLNSTQFGMVGVATKGPVNERKFISSIDQFTKMFGIPATNMYGVYAALEYLKEGNGLWYVRVQSGTTPAVTATVSLAVIDGGSPIVVSAKDPGTYYNSVKLTVTHKMPANLLHTEVASPAGTSFTFSVANVPLAKSSITVTVGGDSVTDNGAGVLGADGNITGGTVDYNTGEVVVNFTSSNSTDIVVTGKYYTGFDFSLSRTINGRDYVVAVHRNMVLSSQSPNYYVTLLTNSEYIQVPTLGTDFPLEQTLTFANGADGLSGIADADYIGTRTGSTATGLQLLAVPSEVDINGIACPGITTNAVVQELVSIAEARRDCVAVIDTPNSLLPADVVDWANGNNAYSAYAGVSSSYAAIYYPWTKITDPYNSIEVFVPPSGFVAAAYARADRDANYSSAPAGAVRGKMRGATGAALLLNQADRDLVYSNRINPVTDFAVHGLLIFGQKTAQTFPSALDRVGTRRMLIRVEKSIVTAMIPFVFEPHNQRTWTQIRQTIDPYLESRKQSGDLYEYRVVVGETNNPPAEIDQNRLHVDIFLKPTRYAEEIVLSFNVLNTGADIDEYVSSVR